MKKALCAISTAVLLATGATSASAEVYPDQEMSDRFDAVERLAGLTFGTYFDGAISAATVIVNNNIDGGGIDNDIDIDDILDNADFDIYIGGEDGSGMALPGYELFDTKVSVLSGAINYADINGSVHIDASSITLNAGNAAGTLDLDVNANTESIAYLGNRITTLAAGAMIQGELSGTEMDMTSDTLYNSVGVMSAAINAGNIDAQVHLDAVATQTGLFSYAPGLVALSNISIGTTAIGALNGGRTSAKIVISGEVQ